MMLPNQITLQNFSQTGKGGYKALEVDAFLQRVYQSYNKLYTENKALSDRLDDLVPQIEEYNRSKSSIADALIWAKSTAEKNIEEAKTIAENLVADATVKSEKLFEEKKAEADNYYVSKTSAADERLEKANKEFDALKQQSEIYSERYISEINVKTRTIIEDANSKAASIVADAYADAKKAREKADRIIAEANKELDSIKKEADKIKKEILSLISYAQLAAESVNEITFEHAEAETSETEEILEAKQIDTEEIESFSLNGIENLTTEDTETSDENAEPDESAKPVQPDYVRFFGADIPDVNEILSGIFSAVNAGNSQNNEDENSFKFTSILSGPEEREDTKQFDILSDSED